MTIATENSVFTSSSGALIICYAGNEIPDDATPWIPLTKTPEQLLSEANLALKWAAQVALDATDLVAFRCFKAGVAYPAEWQQYTTDLRSISNGTDTTSTSLPVKPAYPAGT
jgi:hypothetical protein